MVQAKFYVECAKTGVGREPLSVTSGGSIPCLWPRPRRGFRGLTPKRPVVSWSSLGSRTSLSQGRQASYRALPRITGDPVRVTAPLCTGFTNLRAHGEARAVSGGLDARHSSSL